jgi:17beta-estradiol 17-dehydrogenase / very-long-chain 3-oxoacyl-CoA reductase
MILISELQARLAGYTADSLASVLLAAFALIGLVAVFQLVFRINTFVWVYFGRPGKNLKKLGEWAVVTGATDGIGKAYAEALAKRGLNIVLISRTESKLQAIASDLESRFRVQTKVIAADFASTPESVWEAIAAVVSSVPVGLLINSAGVSYDHAEYFDAVSQEDINSLIQVNVVATTRMCSIVVPGMKARKRGAIVNVGSGSATFLPSYPLYGVYGATKAYVDELSRDLHAELAPLGVTVENQAPFYVATKMSKIRRPRLDAPSPAAWVEAGLRQIGWNSTASPYWVHSAMAAVVGSLPDWLMNAYLLSAHKSLRARWYKKQARSKNA